MKLLKILLAVVFFTFLVSSVSAVSFDAEFQSGATSAIITEGQSINLYVDGGSMHPPTTITISLKSDIIYTETINSKDFSKTYEITPSIYSNAGTYIIEISAIDATHYNDFAELTLIVIPKNNPPEITSKPITEVNENDFYSYQVTATDADDDALMYFLTEKPSWLSISSSGLIIGTAPLVSVNTDYSISIEVSDGKDSTIQDYVLTVKNIPEIIPDTTSPIITILSENPVNVEVFSNYVDAGATAYDDIDGDLTDSIVKTKNVDTNVLGTYYVSYSVEDNAGNPATATRIVNVVDTTSSVITLLGENPQIIKLGNLYTELGATAQDNYDGNLTNNISIDISDIDIYVIGSYEIFYTVLDSSGNEAQAIRIFKVVPKTEPEPTDDKGVSSKYSYKDIDEVKYFEQFREKTPIPYKEVPEPKTLKNWPILILIIGIIALIIVIALILINRLKY